MNALLAGLIGVAATLLGSFTVYQFPVYIAFATFGSRGYLAISTWSSFPPCTQVTFNLRAIAESYIETAEIISPGHLNHFDYGITFKDATGHAWHRYASGTLLGVFWLNRQGPRRMRGALGTRARKRKGLGPFLPALASTGRIVAAISRQRSRRAGAT